MGKKLILTSSLIFLFISFTFSAEKIKVFWGLRDPNSFIQNIYLKKLENKFDKFDIKKDVKMYEVDYNEKNFDLFEREWEKVVDDPFGYVPFTVFQDHYVVGTDYDKLERLVKKQMVVNLKSKEKNEENFDNQKVDEEKVSNEETKNKNIKNQEIKNEKKFFNTAFISISLVFLFLSVIFLIIFKNKKR